MLSPVLLLFKLLQSKSDLNFLELRTGYMHYVYARLSVPSEQIEGLIIIGITGSSVIQLSGGDWLVYWLSYNDDYEIEILAD